MKKELKKLKVAALVNAVYYFAAIALYWWIHSIYPHWLFILAAVFSALAGMYQLLAAGLLPCSEAEISIEEKTNEKE